MKFPKDGVLDAGGERSSRSGRAAVSSGLIAARRWGVSLALGVVGVLGVLGLWGCSVGSGELSVSDYSTSCQKTDECVVIFVGDICKCQCRYGAISQSSYPQYQLDRAAIKCDNVCSPCPTSPKAVCDPLTRSCGLE